MKITQTNAPKSSMAFITNWQIIDKQINSNNYFWSLNHQQQLSNNYNLLPIFWTLTTHQNMLFQWLRSASQQKLNVYNISILLMLLQLPCNNNTQLSTNLLSRTRVKSCTFNPTYHTIIITSRYLPPPYFSHSSFIIYYSLILY